VFVNTGRPTRSLPAPERLEADRTYYPKQETLLRSSFVPVTITFVRFS